MRLSGAIRVLVTEDEEDILTIVMMHLKANGFVPNGFTDPLAALEEFESDPGKYDAFLSDVRMPAMTGIELAREIHKINPETKIVLMTAYEVVDDELDGLPVVKVDEIIKKPFRLTEICNRIKKVVNAN